MKESFTNSTIFKRQPDSSVFSVLCFLFFLPLQAQITSSQILSTAKNDAIFQLKQGQTEDLRNNPFVMSNWDDVELRVRRNRFETARNEYALRMTRNPNEMIKQQERVHQSLLQIADIESVIEFSNALESRYGAILQLKFSEELQAKRAALILILEDEKRVIENRLALGLDDDLEDLAEIEEELQDEALEAFEFDFFKNALNEQIAGWTDEKKRTGADLSDFISIEKMNEVAAGIESESVLNHPELRRRAFQSDLALQEEFLEKREDQTLINFLQVRYREDPGGDDILREKFSVSMGLRLGAKKIGSLRTQELEVERLEAQKEAEIQRVDLEKDFAEVIKERRFLNQKLQLLLNQAEAYRKKYAPEIFLSKGITNPMTLLKAKEAILKKEILIKKTEFELLENYLELLFSSGKPVQLPMRNFLSESLEEF